MPPSLIARTLRKHPSGLLLAGQLLAVLLNPLLEGTRAGRPVFMIFGNVILVLALWVVFRSPLVSWIGWVLALPAMMISLLSLVGGNTQFLVTAYILQAILYFYAAIGLTVYMLSDAEVTADEILAAG